MKLPPFDYACPATLTEAVTLLASHDGEAKALAGGQSLVHGQTIGAIVQGLGGAFLEHFVYDADGQLLTGSFADYLLPTASDFPAIRAIALENSPSPNNPLGAKGAGEGGIIPVGGVVANAVAAALSSLGVEPRALPLSPPRLWEMIDGRVNC
jgi:aerobic carbon-monoxide dehydrogenase large subunit